MATKMSYISATIPAVTTGPSVAKGGALTPAELDQNFRNLSAGIDLFVGEAKDQAEENLLFASGYRFVIRTDLIAGYVPPSLSPIGTVTMTAMADLLPSSTIYMVIQ